MSHIVKLILMLALNFWACSAFAIDPLPFADQKEEQRFQALTAELRCLQCQNQNLADSDAGLAKDMRKQVLSMMQKGDSDQQIKQYMVDRYGDFVVYTPPFNWQNALLWLLPILVALSGLMFVYWHFGASSAPKATSPANHDKNTSAIETESPNKENNNKASTVDAGDNW